METMVDSVAPDIILGCESWLDSSVTSASVFPEGYVAYRKDRPGDNHGGVFILVSSRLESSQPENLQLNDRSELVWVEVKIPGTKNLFLCSFYRPPRSRQPDLFSELDECLRLIPGNAHVWVGGDFNLTSIDWKKHTVEQYPTDGTLCRELLDLSLEHNLTQVVSRPTRLTLDSQTMTDLFFTNNPSLVNTSKVIPGISDHEAIYIESSLRPFINKSVPREIFQYNKANFDMIKQKLSEKENDFDNLVPDSSCNDLWESFKNTLISLMDEFIPKKTIRNKKNHKPWITPHIRTLHRRLSRLLKRTRQTNDPSIRQRYLKTKANVQRIRRQSYWHYINNIIDPPDEEGEQRGPSNQKRFWHYIKSLRRDNCGVSPLRDHEGKLNSAPLDKANILNHQYESVFTKEDPSSIPSLAGEPYPDMADIEISEEGVKKLLKNLNPHKATGPDGLPAKILKECANEIAPFLTKIFRKAFEEGNVPEDWKKASVTAVFKKGDRHNAANYRPVSLTSLCCKIQEHILTSNIRRHLAKHNILTNSQHGFRERRSCETQLLTLAHELASNLDKGSRTDLIILDFAKAFDKVPHQRLLGKLSFYGIRGQALEWIRAFLSNQTQEVMVDGARSSPAPVISGVPQGTVLGPILFLLFINDLPNDLTSNVRLFADDCIVYRRISSRNDCDLLQKDLNILNDWERKWGMEFHPKKCNVLSCTTARKPFHYDYTLKGHTLAYEQTSKYLGVDLTSNLSWHPHIDRITKKACNMIGFLRRNLQTSNRQTKTNAYNTLVRPHVEYCSTVWSPHTKELIGEIEKVQRRGARYVCNKYGREDSVSGMLEELGWESLESRRTKTQLTFMYKIINNLVDITPQPYLEPGNARTRSNHNLKFRQIQTKRDTFKFSFFPRTIPIWNSLPASSAEAPSLASFKREIKNLNF